MKLLSCLGNKLIPSVFLPGLVLASDGFNDLTDSMNPEISSIREIVYQAKTVQFMHDSAWVDKVRKLNTFDSNGYLVQTETFVVDETDWILKSKTLIDRDNEGNFSTKTKQVVRGGDYHNRYRQQYIYDDNGLALGTIDQKWHRNNWRNKKLTTNNYEGEFIVDVTVSKWRQGVWMNHKLYQISYSDIGQRDEKISFKIRRDSTMIKKNKVSFIHDENSALVQKSYFSWKDSSWVERARVLIEYNDSNRPVSRMLQKKDSSGTFINVSISENLYTDEGAISSRVKSWWKDSAWKPFKRYVYDHENSESRANLSAFDGTMIPQKVLLAKAFPNPFNPVTTIQYELSSREHIVIEIYNMTGSKIKTIFDQVQLSGIHSVAWDGKNTLGQDVAAGVYLYSIKAGPSIISKKIILLK